MPVVEVEALATARASASIDGHAFFAEHVTDAFLIGWYAWSGGPEPIRYVAVDGKHPIDVRHGVTPSSKPFADRLAAVVGRDASGSGRIPVGCPASLRHRRDECGSTREVDRGHVSRLRGERHYPDFSRARPAAQSSAHTGSATIPRRISRPRVPCLDLRDQRPLLMGVKASSGGRVDSLIVPWHEPGALPAWEVAAPAQARLSRI